VELLRQVEDQARWSSPRQWPRRASLLGGLPTYQVFVEDDDIDRFRDAPGNPKLNAAPDTPSRNEEDHARR
jgi:hypothetical protein